MKTFFLTFGQVHRHVLKGVYFDKDCVVRIEAKNRDDAREIAFMVFGQTWSILYDNLPDMFYFPRGVVGPVFERGVPYNVRHLVEAIMKKKKIPRNPAVPELSFVRMTITSRRTPRSRWRSQIIDLGPVPKIEILPDNRLAISGGGVRIVLNPTELK